MKKSFHMIVASLILISAALLAACTGGDNLSESTKSTDENLVTEYSSKNIKIPDSIGAPIRFCTSDEYVYVLGDGSGESIVVRYDQNSGDWEGLSNANYVYTPLDISFYEKLWMLMQDENGRYFCCSVDDNRTSDAIQLNISSDDRITGFYAYSSGLLLWNYSSLYLCDYVSGNTIMEKQLSGALTLNGISASPYGIYAQINSNGENCLLKLEDIFSGTSESLKYDGLSALVPLCISNSEKCLVGNIESVTSYDINSKEYIKLFSWTDIGCMMPDLVPAVIENSDESLFILDRYSGNLIQIIPQLVSEKSTITLATSVSSSVLNQIIYEFNQSNSLYKIETKIYSANDIDRLRTEIIAGRGPDIIDTVFLPIDGEPSGYYEDLLPYIENDQEISESDFIPNIFEASKIDGALYYLMPSFDIYTVISTDDGPKKDCSFDEYLAQLADIDDSEIDTDMSAEEIFLSAFPIIEDDIVTSTDSGEAIDMQCLKQWLSFCKEAESYNIPFETISNCLKVGLLSKNNGNNINFIGLPGQTNCGSYATPDNTCFAMLSTCAHKEAAWSFMRQMLLPAYQDNVAPFGFPVNSHSLDNAIEESLKDEKMDFTQADAEILRELIYSVDVVTFSDDTLENLVKPIANAYFNGQYNIDETAALIESKVNIFLSERS